MFDHCKIPPQPTMPEAVFVYLTQEGTVMQQKDIFDRDLSNVVERMYLLKFILTMYEFCKYTDKFTTEFAQVASENWQIWQKDYSLSIIKQPENH